MAAFEEHKSLSSHTKACRQYHEKKRQKTEDYISELQAQVLQWANIAKNLTKTNATLARSSAEILDNYRSLASQSIGEKFMEEAAKDEKISKYLIGLTNVEFASFFEEVKDTIAMTTLRCVERQRSEPIVQLSARCQLFLTLYFLRHNPSAEFLAFIFCISTSSVWAYIHRIVYALDAFFKAHPEIVWPSDSEMQACSVSCGPAAENIGRVAAAVDGFTIRCSAPTHEPWKWRSSPLYIERKQIFAFNFLLVVLMTGVIIFLSEAMPGGTYTDQAVWNHCGLRNKFLDKEYGIVADKGFTLNPAGMRPIPGANMLKRPRRGKLSAKQEQFNLAISHRRLVVENTIAQLRKWNLLAGKYRCKPPEDSEAALFLSRCVRVIGHIVNKRLKKRPLRHLTPSPSHTI